MQQKKALLNIRNRMQRDYNMIASRYMKLFNGLNANLRMRVFELDKQAIDFAVREADKFSNRGKYLTAAIPVMQLESLSISQKILASNVKFRGMNVIGSMGRFLSEMKEQKQLTDQILINDNAFRETSRIFIPVAIYESVSDRSATNIGIAFPESELDSAGKSAVRNSVYSSFGQIPWKGKAGQDEEVSGEFTRLLTGSQQPQRVKDMIFKLFRSHDYQTIQTNG
jgi:hypothetical protein